MRRASANNAARNGPRIISNDCIHRPVKRTKKGRLLNLDNLPSRKIVKIAKPDPYLLSVYLLFESGMFNMKMRKFNFGGVWLPMI